ncbi:MAG: hypothetical protein Q8N51_06145, partial [Gammaproteobacteria bacterium]|nr:hypothetical protein [Gammaproteobacteria bacterium]
TALAFVGSSLQHRRSLRHTVSPHSGPNPGPQPAAMRQAHPGGPPAPQRPKPQPGPAKSNGGGFGVMFQGEIAQLRGLALGMLFGVLRDVVMDSVSKPVAQHVDGMFDSFTNRMGGKPVHGRMLPERKRPEPVPDMDEPETAVAPEL